MLKYIIKRLLLLIPVVFGITFIIFVVLNLAPGDPAAMILGQDATAEALAAKRAEMGLDQPIVIQYIRYIAGVLRGDFGTSWLSGYEVLPEFLHRIPYTILLGSLSMFVAVIIGIPLGIIAAIRQYHFVDYASLALALILFSLPSFWFAMMGQILFCLTLGWLPAAGVGSLAHFILPSIIASFGLRYFPPAYPAFPPRVWRQDYIRTARAKGADERRVVAHHVLRNGMLPVVTQVGISFASCMGGSVITETVFSIPGIGSLLINAVKGRDIPVVMGTLIFIAIFVGIVNLIVDVIYALIDPRVKLTA